MLTWNRKTKVRDAEKRLSDLVRMVSDWMWETNTDLRFTAVSDRTFEIFELPPHSLLGSTFEEIGVTTSGALALDSSRKAFNGRKVQFAGADGNIRHLVLSGVPIFDDGTGKFLGMRGVARDVTAQRHAEVERRRAWAETEQRVKQRTHELAEANDKLRQLSRAVQQSSSAVIITDTDGTIVYVNRRFSELSGYSELEAVGQSPAILRSDLTPSGKHQELWKRLEAGEEWKGEVLNRNKQGDLYWASLAVSPIKDDSGQITHYLGTQEDITERKEAEAEVQRSQETLRLFMDSATDWFVILDGDLNYVDANRAMVEAYGTPKEELVGRNLSILAPQAKTSGRYDKYLEVIRTGEPHQFEFEEVSPRDGRTTFLSAKAFKVGTGLGLVVQNVTEQRQAEELLRSAKEEAELANRTKSEFLANMTHELRTPLNAVIGFSQALERGIGGAVTDKQREYLKDIGSSGDHLLDIINDILDLSKFELAAMEILEEQVNLAETVSGSLRLVRDRLNAAGLTLQVGELNALPLLRGDKRRLKQVLLNLLSNAIKFTNRGGCVTICGETAEDGSVCLAVTDDGIGMTPSDIEKSLTQFGQVESGLARNYEGTGLGLPISKSIMKAHGGKLEIESEPGEGTTVTLIFPASRAIRGLRRAS